MGKTSLKRFQPSERLTLWEELGVGLMMRTEKTQGNREENHNTNIDANSNDNSTGLMGKTNS